MPEKKRLSKQTKNFQTCVKEVKVIKGPKKMQRVSIPMTQVTEFVNYWMDNQLDALVWLATQRISQSSRNMIKPTTKQNQMKSSFLIREKMVQKAYRVKTTRAKHSGQDWGQALIFTYRHRHDCLTNNKWQRLVNVTIYQQLALIDVTVSELSVLEEGSKRYLEWASKETIKHDKQTKR